MLWSSGRAGRPSLSIILSLLAPSALTNNPGCNAGVIKTAGLVLQQKISRQTNFVIRTYNLTLRLVGKLFFCFGIILLLFIGQIIISNTITFREETT